VIYPFKSVIRILHLATRMAALGKIEEYCVSTEDRPQYIERLEFFLIANKVTDEDLKRTTLLSVIGPCTFKVLRNLLALDKL